MGKLREHSRNNLNKWGCGEGGAIVFISNHGIAFTMDLTNKTPNGSSASSIHQARELQYVPSTNAEGRPASNHEKDWGIERAYIVSL